MPTNYSAGTEAERHLRKVLEEAGYSVTRGAGSKGTAFGMKVDIIATRTRRTREETAYINVRDYGADEVVLAQLKSQKINNNKTDK